MSSETIKELVDALGEGKEGLIRDIRMSVKHDVSSLQASRCFSVVDNRKNYTPPSIDWGKRFVAFCRKKRFHGRKLDSPVTEVVTDSVSKCFLKFYNKKSDDISSIIANDLVNNELFIDSIAEVIHDAKIIKGSKLASASLLKKHIKDIIISALNSAQSQAVAYKVTAVTSAAVSAAASSTIGPLIMKQLALHSKVVVAKILTSAAFKTMVTAAVKKFALAAIIAFVTHALWGLIGAKVAAALGSAVIPVISAGILGWVVYEMANMPKKLGVQLSLEVSAKISDDFKKINKVVAKNIYNEIGKNFGDFAASLIDSDEFVVAINDVFDSHENVENLCNQPAC